MAKNFKTYISLRNARTGQEIETNMWSIESVRDFEVDYSIANYARARLNCETLMCDIFPELHRIFFNEQGDAYINHNGDRWYLSYIGLKTPECDPDISEELDISEEWNKLVE